MNSLSDDALSYLLLFHHCTELRLVCQRWSDLHPTLRPVVRFTFPDSPEENIRRLASVLRTPLQWLASPLLFWPAHTLPWWAAPLLQFWNELKDASVALRKFQLHPKAKGLQIVVRTAEKDGRRPIPGPGEFIETVDAILKACTASTATFGLRLEFLGPSSRYQYGAHFHNDHITALAEVLLKSDPVRTGLSRLEIAVGSCYVHFEKICVLLDGVMKLPLLSEMSVELIHPLYEVGTVLHTRPVFLRGEFTHITNLRLLFSGGVNLFAGDSYEALSSRWPGLQEIHLTINPAQLSPLVLALSKLPSLTKLFLAIDPTMTPTFVSIEPAKGEGLFTALLEVGVLLRGATLPSVKGLCEALPTASRMAFSLELPADVAVEAAVALAQHTLGSPILKRLSLRSGVLKSQLPRLKALSKILETCGTTARVNGHFWLSHAEMAEVDSGLLKELIQALYEKNVYVEFGVQP